uniref:DUF3741 domain-containing protein n=1 Tax=Setaria digitata TaxID=48799 RepID=A0A915PMN2_9BILA
MAAGAYLTHISSPQGSSGLADGSGSSVSGRRSLLKHIFRSESSNTVTSSNNGNTSSGNKRNVRTELEKNNLAQCRAFIPLEEHKITSSQSAFALSSTSSLSTQYDCPDSLQPDRIDVDDSLPKRKWFTGHPHPRHHATPSLLTFKPGRSANDIATQEEMQKLDGTTLRFSVNPKPVVKPKPLALRRERSDLTGGHVPRIAGTHRTDRSAAVDDSSIGVRRVLMPPSTCLDENTLRKCLEELKRKKQEVAVAISEADSRSRQQLHSQRNHRKEISEIDSDNINVILRAHSRESFRTEQRRLSVPDLADLAHNPLVNGVNGVTTTAKALTSKLGRNPRTGELQTINEGLVTPVIRRKQYLKDIHSNNGTNEWCAGSLLQKPSSSGKEAEQEHLRVVDRGAGEHIFARKADEIEICFSSQIMMSNCFYCVDQGNVKINISMHVCVDSCLWKTFLQRQMGVDNAPA